MLLRPEIEMDERVCSHCGRQPKGMAPRCPQCEPESLIPVPGQASEDGESLYLLGIGLALVGCVLIDRDSLPDCASMLDLPGCAALISGILILKRWALG